MLKSPFAADVAELADAQASGACGLRLVEVRLLSSAFFNKQPFFLPPDSYTLSNAKLTDGPIIKNSSKIVF